MAFKIISNNFHKVGFVSIVENLDISITSQLLCMGWQETPIKANYKNLFLVVDDPLTRWYRQVCQQFTQSSHVNVGFNKDDLIDFLLYNKINCVSFTDHQKNYSVQDFSEKITYFKLSNKLGYMINHFLHDNNISNTFNNQLKIPDSNSKNILTLQNFLNKDINKPYLNKVTNYLQQDYDFIKTIKFYAR